MTVTSSFRSDATTMSGGGACTCTARAPVDRPSCSSPGRARSGDHLDVHDRVAEGGVPLARIDELLVAGPDEFVAALAEIDRALAQ